MNTSTSRFIVPTDPNVPHSFRKKHFGSAPSSSRMQGNPYLHFVTFVTFVSFCSKIFCSILLYSQSHEIWYQSSSEFARLRPTLVIYRVLEAKVDFSVVGKFARLHPSSRHFDFLFFVLSYFHDHSSIRLKRNHQEDHENTKE